MQDNNVKRYGKYRALVVDSEDPERRGRIKVKCPSVFGSSISGWCEVCLNNITKDRIDFQIPAVKSQVWIEFENGDTTKGVYTGSWLISDQTPSDLKEFEERIIQYGLFRQHFDHNESTMFYDFATTDLYLYRFSRGGLEMYFDTEEGQNFLQYGSGEIFTQHINPSLNSGFTIQYSDSTHLHFVEYLNGVTEFSISTSETKNFTFSSDTDLKININGHTLEYSIAEGFKIVHGSNTLILSPNGTFGAYLGGNLLEVSSGGFHAKANGSDIISSNGIMSINGRVLAFYDQLHFH